MTPCRWTLLLFVVCLTWTGSQSWWRRRRRRCATNSCQWKWSACSRTCGEGTKSAIKTKKKGACGSCNMPTGLHPCNPQCCASNCYWSDWSPWSSCSPSCGGEGVQTRSRNANGPICGGTKCQGAASETRDCYTDPCPIHCSWGLWGDWCSCSLSCGGGNQSRSRTHAVEPQYGGDTCQGDSREDRSCNTKCCPVDCVWNNWGNWVECSVSCGDGSQNRQRRQAVAQACGGSHCEGESIESRLCNAGCCPTNCNWGAWGQYGECSKSCNLGTHTRNRNISLPASCGGDQCRGGDHDTGYCNAFCCKDDCQWREGENNPGSYICTYQTDDGYHGDELTCEGKIHEPEPRALG